MDDNISYKLSGRITNIIHKIGRLNILGHIKTEEILKLISKESGTYCSYFAFVKKLNDPKYLAIVEHLIDILENNYNINSKEDLSKENLKLENKIAYVLDYDVASLELWVSIKYRKMLSYIGNDSDTLNFINKLFKEYCVLLCCETSEICDQSDLLNILSSNRGKILIDILIKCTVGYKYCTKNNIIIERM